MKVKQLGLRVAVFGIFALSMSQQAFADGTSPEGSAAREAQAKADEAAYKAMEAAAKAKEAMHKAEVAAAQAKFGGTPAQTTIQGDTSLATTAAVALKGEGMLLSVNAARIASDKIVTALGTGLAERHKSDKRPLMVLTSLADLATPDAIQFDFDKSKSETLLLTAQSAFDYAAARDRRRDPDVATDGGVRLAPVAAIGSLVGSLANIGSFFQSNYALGEISVTLPATLIADTVVAELKKDSRKSKDIPVINPTLLIVTEATELQGELDRLQRNYAIISANATVAKARHAVLAAADPKTCKDCTEVAMAYQLAEANSNSAKAAFEALMTNLAAAPASGQQPFAVRVARQRAVRKLMNAEKKPYVLLLANTATAGYITKKNLWTFLGEPPVRAMGTMTVNYSLFDPSTPGAVIISDVVGVHGGYKTLRGVERLFSDRPADSSSSRADK